MTHWGKYWKRIGHIPKRLCEQHACLDSFQIFKNKNLNRLPNSNNSLSIDVLLEIGKLQVTMGKVTYRIDVEKQPCHFGGYRLFLRCPGTKCNRRMRKLYCFYGIFLCRKCLNLGYYSQRVFPSERYRHMKDKLEDKLKNAGGSLWQKPKWMHNHTFKDIQDRCFEYDCKSEEAIYEEFYNIYAVSMKRSL